MLADVAKLVTRWSDDKLAAWCANHWNSDAWSALWETGEAFTAQEILRIAEFVPTPWPSTLTSVMVREIFGQNLEPLERLHAAELSVEAGEQDALLRDCPVPAPEWIHPLLIKIGDCDAEKRMIEKLSESGQLPSWPLRGDLGWIRYLRCPETAYKLAEVARRALIGGSTTNDIGEVFRAMDRCAGLDSLKLYDLLISDARIPGSRFLYYERQTALESFVEHRARAGLDMVLAQSWVMELGRG